jgi:hypothetical protein
MTAGGASLGNGDAAPPAAVGGRLIGVTAGLVGAASGVIGAVCVSAPVHAQSHTANPMQRNEAGGILMFTLRGAPSARHQPWRKRE